MRCETRCLDEISLESEATIWTALIIWSKRDTNDDACDRKVLGALSDRRAKEKFVSSESLLNMVNEVGLIRSNETFDFRKSKCELDTVK